MRSSLTRLQVHWHEAEARHLRDAIYGPTKRGGDRGNQYTGGKVANGHGDRLPESDSLAAQTESTEAFGAALRTPLQASFGGGVRSA